MQHVGADGGEAYHVRPSEAVWGRVPVLERERGRTQAATHVRVAVVLVLLLSGVACDRSTGPDGGNAHGRRTMIAVLPFENLGAPDDEYFADGITEEISGRLGAVPELGVISRTSVRQYGGTNKSIKEIAHELGVDYVLEGTVRWDRSAGVERVVIAPSLVRASDETYVWSEQYDRVPDDIFRTQSEIAGRVIEHLDVTLRASARRRIESQPTANLEAYQAYLRGLESTRSAEYDASSWQIGVSMFERAAELDPGFAEAHAELSRVHSRGYHLGFDRTIERLELARTAAERAVVLDPGLGRTRLALAYYYYWGFKDYANALAELDATQEDDANDTSILEARGYILRRQGRYAEAADNLARALELNPRDATVAVEVANTNLGLWRFARALEHYDLAIALAPDRTGAYTLKVRNRYLWDGDLGKARATLDAMPVGDSIRALWFRAFQDLFERNYAAVITRLEARRDETYQTHAQTIPLSLVMAWAWEGLGDSANAGEAYERALAILEEAREQQPGDFRIVMALGLTHAGLGHTEEGIRLGNRGVEMYPISKDAWAGPIVARNRVLVLTRAGAFDAALDQIEALLAFPNPGASLALFRIDPRLDPLHELPRFEQILQRASVPASEP